MQRRRGWNTTRRNLKKQQSKIWHGSNLDAFTTPRFEKRKESAGCSISMIGTRSPDWRERKLRSSSYVTARRKLRKSRTLRTQPFSRVLAIRLAVGAGSGSEQRPPSRKPKQPRRINKWSIRVRKLGLSGPNTQSGLTRKRLHTRSSTLMLWRANILETSKPRTRDRNDPKSGPASPAHTTNLSGLVLGVSKPTFGSKLSKYSFCAVKFTTFFKIYTLCTICTLLHRLRRKIRRSLHCFTTLRRTFTILQNFAEFSLTWKNAFFNNLRFGYFLLRFFTEI